MNEKEIIDGLKVICKCQGIKKRTFLKHIASGVGSVAELQLVTGAGSGDCQGKQCTQRIDDLLQMRTHPKKRSS